MSKSKIVYLGYIFFGSFNIFCEDETKSVNYYSLENSIMSNPELSHQILDGYIVNVETKSKLALVKIIGERKDVDDVEKRRSVVNKRGVSKNKKKGSKVVNSPNVVNGSNNDVKKITKTSGCECSGFLISNDGYIITNCSLIKNYSELYTKLTVKGKKGDVEKKVKLDLVGYDEYLDIALLKGNIKTLNNVVIGNYGPSKVFRYVYCICGDDYKVSGFTDIEFSGRNSKKKGDNVKKINTYSSSYDYLKPCILVDINGFLVGMRVNCGKFVKNEVCGYKSIIPFNALRKSIAAIKSNKYNAFEYGCFNLVSVDDRLKGLKRLSVNHGCYVDKITCNNAKLGLKVGDVILGINGYSVSDIESFERAYSCLKNDDLVFSVSRNGQVVNVKVVSGIVSDVKYDIVGNNTLVVDSAKLVNLDDTKLNLLKNLGVFNVKGVLVSDVSNLDKWECGNDFVITNVYGKYGVGSITDIVNVFKNIDKYINKSDTSNGIPFIISGFYINKPNNKRSFVLYI